MKEPTSSAGDVEAPEEELPLEGRSWRQSMRRMRAQSVMVNTASPANSRLTSKWQSNHSRDVPAEQQDLSSPPTTTQEPSPTSEPQQEPQETANSTSITTSSEVAPQDAPSNSGTPKEKRRVRFAQAIPPSKMRQHKTAKEPAQMAMSTWSEPNSDTAVAPGQEKNASRPQSRQSQRSADETQDYIKGKRHLEGQLNRHLGQLDRIRRIVRQLNNDLQELEGQLSEDKRLDRDDPELFVVLQKELATLHDCRNSYAHVVAFHHEQIQSIADQRAELDKNQGLECTVYHMYLNHIKHVEWYKSFS
ncbi:uncharacterized protein PV06_02243 [Exophiala oligosperma]|uniref:Uncharacterized protein n=1 Tax=Exophiala oligosperma TaxID=215243 RepID=A0A0D2C9U1_9EURO|nr:uncharacterized protein PV06_02243 [Exophiala oligosperma]KIW46577.1 hypothetical protein PV06_02243 [Exophiala oligosperma]